MGMKNDYRKPPFDLKCEKFANHCVNEAQVLQIFPYEQSSANAANGARLKGIVVGPDF